MENAPVTVCNLLTLQTSHSRADEASFCAWTSSYSVEGSGTPSWSLLCFRSPAMSSPARSSASATSAGQGGGNINNAAFGDDNSPYHFPTDLISPHERKEEALAVLKSDLMEALQKEVKSLDDDNWMFAGPRSQINLISRPGANLWMQTGKHGEVNHHFKQTRHVER